MGYGVLIIEDEVILARKLSKFLQQSGFDTRVVDNGGDALDALSDFPPDAVVLDYNLPGQLNGLEVLRRLREQDKRIKVIMVTGHGSERLAVDAMKAGAFDYLSKPIVLSELKILLDRAMEQRRTEGQLSYFHDRQAHGSDLEEIVGESPAIRAMREQIQRIIEAGNRMTAGTTPPILIFGETGTGKELVARALHFGGNRREQPFVELNVAAIPSHLVESELFGYERGAFTDARTRKQGLIEAADGGTLFLDEIGELDMAVQAKLLKLLEDRRVRRLGSVRDHEVDIQIVTATNRDLRAEAEAGRFRQDLYFRLNTLTLAVPPLRDRSGDVGLLARHFVGLFARKYAKADIQLGADAVMALERYGWPGNVRELRNMIEQAVLLCVDGLIDAGHFAFPAAIEPRRRSSDATRPAAYVENVPEPVSDAAPDTDTEAEADAVEDWAAPPGTLESVERDLIAQTLRQVDGNVSKAARKLGITRDQLRYRMDKYGLARRS